MPYSPRPHGFHDPSPVPASDPAPGKQGLELKPTQLAGGALAAVTSAVAASYFGVAGTVLGAAFGSVVSSVAAAVYATSLTRASHRIRTVVVAPASARGGTGTADPHDPTAVPGGLTGARSSVLNETMLLPNGQFRPSAEQPPPHLPPSGSARPGDGGTRPAGGRGPFVSRRLVKPALVLAGVAFVASLGAITATELVIGHPIAAANEKGGLTVKVALGQGGDEQPAKSPPATSTTAPSSLPSDSAGPSASASDSPSSSDSPTTSPSEAGNPPSSPVEPSPGGTGGAGGAPRSPAGGGGPATGAPADGPASTPTG